MTKVKKLLRSPITTVVLFVLAAGLLLAGSIGGVRAALIAAPEEFTSGMDMMRIGVTLVENDTDIAWRDYIEDASAEEYDDRWNELEGWGRLFSGMRTMIDDDGSAIVGKPYGEEIAVRNSGYIDTYVRVTLYRYWETDGEKDPTIDPSYIQIALQNTSDEGGPWVVDTAATTDERIVLYYKGVLPSGETTVPCTKSVTVTDGLMGRAVATTTETIEVRDGRTCRVTRTTYDISGSNFVVEARADAVQNHNAADAIRSAWGIDPALIGLS